MSMRMPGSSTTSSARTSRAGTRSMSAGVLATTTRPGAPSTPSARARRPTRCGEIPTAPPDTAPRDGHSATARGPSRASRSVTRSRASSSRAGTTRSGWPQRRARAASTTAHAGRPSERWPALCPASRRSAASPTGPDASTSWSSGGVLMRNPARARPHRHRRGPRRLVHRPDGARCAPGHAHPRAVRGTGRWPPPCRQPVRPRSW